MKTLRLLALALLATSLASCSSFYVEADQPQACLGLAPQSFSILIGGSQIVGPYEADASWNVDVGLTDAIPSELLNGPPDQSALRLLSFGGAMAQASGANLNWLSNLQLAVVPATGPTVTIAQRAGSLPSGATSFNLPVTNAGYNLVSALQNGSVKFQLSGHVSVPAGTTIPQTWSASVDACFAAHVKKTFEQLINGK